MKKILLILLLFSTGLMAQEITGHVLDGKSTPIESANIYVLNSDIGTVSDKNGNYKLYISNLKNQETIIICSKIGYEKVSKKIKLKDAKIDFVLFSKAYSLDEIIIKPSTFSVGHEGKVTVLKPLDVKTTPNALGDILGVMQNFPGVQNIAGDGRLYIRGGDTNESQFFINGLNVPYPYTRAPEASSVRSKYSPDLFGGIALNTGGYGVEYGQALSGGLFLNSKKFNEYTSKTDISITSVGSWIENIHKKKNNMLYTNLSYTDLTPYKRLFPDDIKWQRDYRQISLNVFDHLSLQKGKGYMKVFTNFNKIDFEIPDYDLNLNSINNKLKEADFYGSVATKIFIRNSIKLHIGSAFSYNKGEIQGARLQGDLLSEENNQLQVRAVLNKKYSNRFKVKIGFDSFFKKHDFDYKNTNTSQIFSFKDNLFSSFLEGAYVPYKKFGVQFGLRTEYSSYTQKENITPRFSINYKINESNNISTSFGQYAQLQNKEYLRENPNLDYQLSNNFILNYSYSRKNDLFRIEFYYKKYKSLITQDIVDNSLKSSGFGYSSGFDLFYKSQIKNFKYWITYSYSDSKRKFLDYQTKIIPTFISKHNTSFVGKYWASKLRSQLGLSLNYNSGTYFDNPNLIGINESRLKPFFDMSINWAFIMKKNIILYSSLSNVSGYDNVVGHTFSTLPNNSSGIFNSIQREPLADRFFFVGLFITLSSNKNINQIDKL